MTTFFFMLFKGIMVQTCRTEKKPIQLNNVKKIFHKSFCTASKSAITMLRKRDDKETPALVFEAMQPALDLRFHG